MSQRDQLFGIIEQDVFDDVRDFGLLNEHMNRLYSLLLARDTVEINVVNECILPLLDAVRGRARRRSKVMGAFPLRGEPQAMDTLIGYFAPDRRARIQTAWLNVVSSAERCLLLNERNGKVLATQSEIVQGLLDPHAGDLYAPGY